MRETLQRFDAEFEKFKTSPQAEKLHAMDRKVGRVIGFAKAVGWIVAAAFVCGVGYLISLYAEGWTAYAAAIVVAVIVFYALSRAWRGLFRAQRASEVVMDEISERVEIADRALGAAQFLHGRFSKKPAGDL